MAFSNPNIGLAKHLDFRSFELVLSSDEADWPWSVTIPVSDPPPGSICDMCEGEVDAVYTIDARSVLGDGGHNTQYCQNHMDSHVFVYADDSPTESWRVKA